MVYDTLRQKYIYNTPFDKKEFPKVDLDHDLSSFKNAYFINASSLYFIEAEAFNGLIGSLKGKIDAIVIKNDLKFKNENKALEEGSKCYILAFAFLFKKNGFFCKIID